MIGADPGLLEQRCHQPIGDAAVADTFANRVDARVVGLQGVIDQDAAVARQAGLLGQFGVGSYACCHDYQIGVDPVAVVELHCGYTALIIAEQGVGLFVEAKAQAALLQCRLQHPSAGLVQLALQQRLAVMNHRDVHAAQTQAVGRFQAEQSSADDDCAFVRDGGVDHLPRVADVAITDDAVQRVAGDRQYEGPRTGGNQQPIIMGLGAVIGDHQAFDAVDLYHATVEQQLDTVAFVPVEVVEHDVFEILFAGQYRRQQDAIVIGVWLGAEDCDVVKVFAQFQQLLECAHAGHAVADHHQFEFGHLASESLQRVLDTFRANKKRRPVSGLTRTPLSGPVLSGDAAFSVEGGVL
ncbi:hypothetical protein ALQ76_05452 [Pseudomonas syringae pv. atrofaciens]|nr:hypothetical protein ALQ76_05452 [Pseudomonas syringae pv. atrofaciens]